VVHAQLPPPPPAIDVPLVTDAEVIDRTDLIEIRSRWALNGAQSAMRAGLTKLGIHLAETALSSGGLNEEERVEALQILAWLSLQSGNLEGARAANNQLSEIGVNAPGLLQAMLAYYAGESQEAHSVLAVLAPEELRPVERGWYYLVEALLLTQSGNTEAANAAFVMAERAAPTAILRQQFEILRLREEIRRGDVTEEEIDALRDSLRRLRGERAGFEAARLLAIALSQLGRDAEAIEILNQQLAVPGLNESGLRPDFLLMMGLIAGPGNPRGRLALSQLVRGSAGVDMQELGLSLLAGSVGPEREGDWFREMLTQWLEEESTHPLRDRFLIYRAFLRMRADQLGLAEEDAQQLLSAYPGSPHVESALRLLAYVSWMQDQPQYRSAADYLSRLRNRVDDVREQQRIGILIADCFFLNGDYVSASEAYGSALRQADATDAGELLFQRVLSEIRANRLDRASAILDAARTQEAIEETALWQAEWNYLDALKERDRLAEALDRVNGLLTAGGDVISQALRVRMDWLRTRLLLDTGDYEAAMTDSAQLLDAMGPGGGYASLPNPVVDGVTSHLLLIRGEAAYRSNQTDLAVSTFGRLREAYPESGPAILSYLVEARAASGEENLVNAQQSLIELADLFPQSEYAPIALWEAALNAEQRGLNQHLREAITILERIVTQYPEHPLVYYARLKQGDLARRLNDFSTALLLYERLLQTFREHPDRWRAEMSRADCLLALGSEDPNRFEDASVAYERLTILPRESQSVRLEAGYKWAQSMKLQGETDAYESVLWLLYDQFLKEPGVAEPVVLVEGGRYWLARLILELGNVAESDGQPAQAIDLYKQLVALGLPGRATAQARTAALEDQLN